MLAAHPQAARQTDAAQQIVQDPDLGVEHDPPDQGHGHRGRRKREDINGLNGLAAPEFAVEIQRNEKPQRQLEAKAQATEIDHHLDPVPDTLIGDQFDEVVQPDEARLPQPHGPLGEGKIQVERNGQHHNQKQHDHRRGRENPGLAAVHEAAD